MLTKANLNRKFIQKFSNFSSINTTIKIGSLTCVVGQVGCGKSSLLNAVLGELEKKQGHLYLQVYVNS